MQSNDIGVYERIGQATMFEGVIASPPAGTKKLKSKLYEGRNDWESVIQLWTPNDLPLRSLIDCVNRLGLGTEVITFISPDAVEPIYNWLTRKGVQTSVLYYEDIESYNDDFKYNRGVKVFYTANYEDAKVLGMRATVVSPNSAWRL
jgi:hypothetical protein